MKNLERSPQEALILLDAGDMFQGTLESNFVEGRSVVEAYNALHMTAAAIGNHEFDYGPAGERALAQDEFDDPRGALKLAASKALFPFLSVNLREKGKFPRWENVKKSFLFSRSNLKIGVIGATTESTPYTTAKANIKDLSFESISREVREESLRLRHEEGAQLVLLLVHDGGRCERFSGDLKSDRCDLESPIFRLARELGPTLIDAIVAGHTHSGLAHEINGIPIIESYSYGRAFGRIDFEIEEGKIRRKKLFEPHYLCPKNVAPEKKGLEISETGADSKQGVDPDPVTCPTAKYEGEEVVRDPQLQAIIAPYLTQVKAKKDEFLGVILTAPIKRNHGAESAEGNLFADLLHEAFPDGSVAIMNGGGLRADLPAGKLRYGELFEAMPFDNHVATVETQGHVLKDIFKENLSSKGSFLSLSGLELTASCKKNELEIRFYRKDGSILRDDEKIRIVASDFLLAGGDHFWGSKKREKEADVRTENELLRDVFEMGLKKRTSIDPKELLKKDAPRLRYEGERPLSCKKEI